MKLKKFLYFVLALTLIAVGIFIGKWIGVPYITIDPSINLLHGLSLLITLFIALAITLVFDTQKKRDSTQKEIMIKRIDRIVDTLDDLQKDVSTGKVGLQFAFAFPKRLIVSIRYVWDAFKLHDITVSVEVNNVVATVCELRRLLTTTPNKAEQSVRNDLALVDNDFLVYGAPGITLMITAIETLKNELFKAQLDINAN
jgi:Ca2+/Na+ antiporter